MLIGSIFWFSAGLIVYTYFGYPLLMFLVSQFWKPETYSSQDYPDVCLVIAAYNEESVLAGKLENSLSLDYPIGKLDILVAADGSDDSTVEISREYADRGVRLSYKPERRGKLAAISRALQSVSADVVVFSDANNLYRADTLRELVVPFNNPKVGAVGGSKTVLNSGSDVGESEGLYWKYEAFIKKQESRSGSCVASSGEIFAIRRTLFTPPLQNLVNDDFYMTMQVLRQGFQVVYRPQARSYEKISASQHDENVRRKRISAGRWQAVWYGRHVLPLRRVFVMWQVVSHKIMRLLLPAAMTVALTASFAALFQAGSCTGPKVLSLCAPYNVMAFTLQGFFYAAAALGKYSSKGTRMGRVLYIPAFLLSSNCAVLQGFFHFLAERDPAVWEKVKREGI